MDKKAIIFKNPCKEDVKQFNETHEDKIKYQSIDTESKNVYLYRNGSNCPELINEKIYASGTAVIVKHNNMYYFVLVKDKIKSVITFPGGTSSLDEYNKSTSIDHMNICTARRELLEETTGTVILNGSIKWS